MKTHWLIVFVVSACGGGVGLDDFETKLVDAVCKNAVECKDAPDLASCKASLQIKNKTLETLIAKSKSGVIKYDSDQASVCIDSIATAGCTFEGFHVAESPCNTVFTGTIATAGACVTDLECAGDAYCNQTDTNCDPSTACCAGTCMAIPAEAQIGGDCTTARCVDTAFCDSSTNRCSALVATAGAACTEIDACANPMICDVFAASPTCVTPAATGATCDPMTLLGCGDFRDYCDAISLKCTARLLPGGACGGTNDASCVGYADCTNMVCVALSTAGGTCTADGDCLGDLECPTASCVLPPAQTACPRLEEPTTSEPPVSTARRAPTRPSRLDWLTTKVERGARALPSSLLP
jgi:hypothetical protein